MGKLEWNNHIWSQTGWVMMNAPELHNTFTYIIGFLKTCFHINLFKYINMRFKFKINFFAYISQKTARVLSYLGRLNILVISIIHFNFNSISHHVRTNWSACRLERAMNIWMPSESGLFNKIKTLSIILQFKSFHSNWGLILL
jgi:hypothetical protein